MLEIWSGGYFISTPHKVVNLSGHERYSFPFFVVPRYDVEVAPLRRAVDGFDRANLMTGEISKEIWLSNRPDAPAVDKRFDPDLS